MKRLLERAAEILVTVAIALITWNLHETYSMKVTTVETSHSLSSLDKSNGDMHKRLEVKLDEMLPRKEAELRFLQIEIKLRELDLKIVELRNNQK